MKFQFVDMTKEYAGEMIKNWKYDGLYRVYDYANEEQELLCVENWGFSKFAVLDEKAVLVGELTIELFREEDENAADDGYIDRAAYAKAPDGVYEMWVGFGLRPDLTGKGLGAGFIAACIKFATSRFSYNGEFIRLAVADFNKRAIRTYQSIGFEVFDTFENAEKKQTILWMKKPIA